MPVFYTMHVNIEQYKKKTVGMAIASISAAGLNYLLNLLFIPKYGYIAAAYTTLISFLWLMLLHIFLVYRIGYGEVYERNKILIMICFMGLYTAGIHFLYGNTDLRYIAIVGYSGLLIYMTIKYKAVVLALFGKKYYELKNLYFLYTLRKVTNRAVVLGI